MVGMSNYPSVYHRSIDLSIHLSILLFCQPIHLSVFPSICLALYLSMQPPIHQTACLCVYLSIYLSTPLFRDLSISLSICLPFHFSFGLSIYLVVFLLIQLSILSMKVPKHFTHPSIWFFIFPSRHDGEATDTTKARHPAARKDTLDRCKV